MVSGWRLGRLGRVCWGRWLVQHWLGGGRVMGTTWCMLADRGNNVTICGVSISVEGWGNGDLWGRIVESTVAVPAVPCRWMFCGVFRNPGSEGPKKG